MTFTIPPPEPSCPIHEDKFGENRLTLTPSDRGRHRIYCLDCVIELLFKLLDQTDLCPLNKPKESETTRPNADFEEQTDGCN